MGLIDDNRLLYLYEADRITDPLRMIFPGHRELLRSGQFDSVICQFGFSMILRGGRITTINRKSSVNPPALDYCMPLSCLHSIIALMGSPVDDNLRVFP